MRSSEKAVAAILTLSLIGGAGFLVYRSLPVAEKKGTYFCPMHPTYTSDRPGDCPICNMKLEFREEKPPEAQPSVPPEKPAQKSGEPAPCCHDAAGTGTHAAVTIQPAQRQLIGIRTGKVEKKHLKDSLRAPGRIVYNERALSAVSLKTAGWIEELRAKAVGDAVKKGETLFTFYSPELLEAQRTYLIAREARADLGTPPSQEAAASFDKDLRSARERLLLLDFGEDLIREIESRKEPFSRVPVRARQDGVVIERNAVEGAYAEVGKEILRIADLSTVWILADLHESEARRVKAGDPVRVMHFLLPDEVFQGTISFLYPFLNEETRTARARIDVPNPEGKLKPGMYCEVTVEADLGERLVVDEEAILDSGTRRIVFVDAGGGRLEPREVKLGPRAAGLAEVLEGLREGETVVTSGNFLIDSESRLQAALRRGFQEAAGGER